jgi:oligopeptide transport system permease protein
LLRYTISRLLAPFRPLLVIITLGISCCCMPLRAALSIRRRKSLPRSRRISSGSITWTSRSTNNISAISAGFCAATSGPSYQYRDTTVNEIIRQGFPIDIVIGGVALAGALLIGLPIGMIAALRRDTGWDHVPMGLSMIGISIPVFVVAPILILIFAVNLHWLPAGGWPAGSLLKVILPAALCRLRTSLILRA